MLRLCLCAAIGFAWWGMCISVPASVKAQDAEERPEASSRIFGESLGALGGAGLSLLLGAATYEAHVPPCEDSYRPYGDDDGNCEMQGVILGGLVWAVSSFFLIPAGAALVGDHLDAGGNYAASLLGAALGAASGLLVVGGVAWVVEVTDARVEIGGIAALAFFGLPVLTSIAGAVIGYELSAEEPEPAIARLLAPSIMPTVSLTAESDVVLGLWGQF